jgi:anti-sigma B factor antagonist
MVCMAEQVEVVGSGVVAVVTLRGELDAHDAPRLRELFTDALTAVGEAESPRLVLDLAAVEFLDSTALGTMIGALRRTREAGGELAIVLPKTTARRIFEITGLDQVLDVRASREAALDHESD